MTPFADPPDAATRSQEPPDAPRAGDASAQAGRGADGFVLRLPLFEGPLDLLLQLIERAELDVTEVSLLSVTEQYLGQLRSGQGISIDSLADFVAMGARLLLLKSRALLPHDEAEHVAGGDDGEDPAALVAALQEYRRFKGAAEHLHGLEQERRTGYRREASPPDMPLPGGLDDVTLDSLVDLFRDVLERLPEADEPPEVERDPVRLNDRIASLVGRLEGVERLSFRAVVEAAATRIEVIVDFLAVLELIKARYIETRQSQSFGDIDLIPIAGAQPPSDADAEGDVDAS